MLKFLHIENIAVIEQSDIEFTGGFNVLTGETGAGKSIVIDALKARYGKINYVQDQVLHYLICGIYLF